MEPVLINEYTRLNNLWCAACALVKKYEANIVEVEQELLDRLMILERVRLKNLHYHYGVAKAKYAADAENYRLQMRSIELQVLATNIKVDFTTWQK